jgi:hypothetical protein
MGREVVFDMESIREERFKGLEYYKGVSIR